MAIRPDAEYPGQVDTGVPGFPYGKARNDDVEGDGSGTPLEKARINDIFGMQQDLLVQGRIDPSGTPDEVGASQYTAAITRMLGPLFALSGGVPESVGNVTYPNDPVRANSYWISPSGAVGALNDRYARSRDGGRTWTTSSFSSPQTQFSTCAAATPVGIGNRAIISGNRAGGSIVQYTADDGATWTVASLPGTPVHISAAFYDIDSQNFIVIGRTGSAPYIATANITDLDTWTSQTVPVSITGIKDALSIAQLSSGVIVATWADQTKFAYSTNGGVTWTASTTPLTSGSYLVIACDLQFLAVLAADNASDTFVSADGITWTATYNAVNGYFDGLSKEGLKYIGGVLVGRALFKDTYSYLVPATQTAWVAVPDVTSRDWFGYAVVQNRLLTMRKDSSTSFIWIERSNLVGLP